MEVLSTIKNVKKKSRGSQEKENEGGVTGGLVCIFFFMGCCRYSGVRGGVKCPEEEHTTCSGGPRINSHKRGLRGERIFYKIKYYFIKYYEKCESIKT